MHTRSDSLQSFLLRPKFLLAGVLGLAAVPAAFGQVQPQYRLVPLPLEVPSVIQRSQLKGHIDPNQVLHLSISLPPANPTGLQALADSVSDPKSPNYRHFVTPAEIGQRFGQPATRIQALSDYLKSQGFTITLVGANRLSILADATAAKVEKAFDTTINNYHALNANEPGRIDYYSYAEPLKLPSTIAPYIVDVGGAENFTKPHPRALTATQTRVLYNSAPIYNNGMRGLGRNVAISSWDGFRLSNVPLYYSAFNLPTPAGGVGSNIRVVPISGGSGAGSPNGEGDLDIQMVLGMAPLSTFTIYDGGGDLISVLTKEANDDSADIISESYGWKLDSSQAAAAHNLHVAMTAQGITYMAATGDFGTDLEPFSYPNYEPEVLQVGGTIASIDSNGKRTNEVGWSGSGGGWSTNSASFNKLPSWQKGTGVPTSINFRLNPDISFNAAGNNTGAYQFVFEGQMNSDFSGTSFASPMFAGLLATAQEKMIATGALPAGPNGKHRLGRMQDAIYAQNGRSGVWFDVKSGSNGTLPNGATSSATTGWDFVTGFGVMDVDAWVASQKVTVPTTDSPVSASVYSNQGQAPSGGPAQLTKTDGAYFSVNSVPQSGLGAIAAAQIGFHTSVPASNLIALQLKVVSNTPRAATNYIYLYNQMSRAWEVVNAAPGSGANSTVSFVVKNFQNYVSSTGQVLMIDRAVLPDKTSGAAFQLKLDEATLIETS
ncbi:S53 family peptidase [Fimbriimonas ginsengisoli]|uniref:Pseudomonapepsin n=1 Tax=Fimbriimonas ginsengisoli Gsoil 348 TaxID=661478 RepID=A0A068NL02_FIMGI|nr:protease pro-enzyme activation domain-containing protein [Fimbriimonas ginsengisoli]AIE84268.1 pseudomonapepsin precursor [Fimbriimonas ginsengisoli Gsoil 348]